MDVSNPQFETYRSRFEALADLVPVEPGRRPEVSSARHFLCLYGDNGLSAAEEFALLDILDTYFHKGLKRMDVETSYWQDIILYVPDDTKALPQS
ncbi:MAG: hypothetical protein AB7P76_07965 [Candidatus Melainabacteria bacterium]